MQLIHAQKGDMYAMLIHRTIEDQQLKIQMTQGMKIQL